jgi:hypothetical protein
MAAEIADVGLSELATVYEEKTLETAAADELAAANLEAERVKAAGNYFLDTKEQDGMTGAISHVDEDLGVVPRFEDSSYLSMDTPGDVVQLNAARGITPSNPRPTSGFLASVGYGGRMARTGAEWSFANQVVTGYQQAHSRRG